MHNYTHVTADDAWQSITPLCSGSKIVFYLIDILYGFSVITRSKKFDKFQLRYDCIWQTMTQQCEKDKFQGLVFYEKKDFELVTNSLFLL